MRIDESMKERRYQEYKKYREAIDEREEFRQRYEAEKHQRDKKDD